MFQNGQKVVVVASGDERRVIKVQSVSGGDESRYPIVTTDGVTGRDQQVQVVSGGDETRFPKLRGLFSPLDLSPAAWYKFNTGITQAGGFVSAWADQSGNGRNFLQGTGTNQPSVSGGVITGDGVDNNMVTASFTLNQPEHLFLVMRQNAWAANDYMVDGIVGDSGALYQTAVSPNLGTWAGGDGPDTNPDPAIAAWSVVQVGFNGASSFVRTDGGAKVTGNAGASNMGGITLFNKGSTAGGYISASVAEIVVFSSEVTGTDLTNLYNYLAAIRDSL